MSTQEEVDQFLKDFKVKLSVFGVVFTQRGKNFETLVVLELTTVNRTELLKKLTVQDYYKGPTQDSDKGADLWEFGIKVKQKDIYIKITMGRINSSVICISFHIAERSINHPFK